MRPGPTGGVTIGWRQVLALLAGIIGLVFIFENRALTEIRLVVPVVTMPLWLALLISLLLGVLIGVGCMAGGGPGHDGGSQGSSERSDKFLTRP
jgi:hypothetical protein